MNNGNLYINNVSISYNKTNVIKNFSTQPLPKGCVVMLLGPNGSGKSTLLKGIAGLNRVKGDIWLDDVNLAHRNDKNIAYLPQAIPNNVHLLVLESIIIAQYQSLNIHFKKNDFNNEINLLECLGIKHLALKYIDELSGGQKQLVGLAQSLIRNPEVLLLDEPLSALDLNYQFHIMKVIRKKTKEDNIITVIAIHDINIALKYADYLLIIKDGNLVVEGIPKEIITSDILASVYKVKGRIESCSQGTKYALIDDTIN